MVSIPELNEIAEDTFNQYFDALMRGDSYQCRKVAIDLLENKIPLVELYRNLIEKSLYKVGDLWAANEISVAQEHLASSITERVLIEIYPYVFSGTGSSRSVIVACVENDYHQIGAKIVADYFEINHWHSYFLGANTPHESIKSMVKDKRPDLLALSITLPEHLAGAASLVAEIKAELPFLKVIAGGQALESNEAMRFPVFASLKQTLQSLQHGVLGA